MRRARRPKAAKLARCPRLRAVVERLLRQRRSPQQIAHRLVRNHPDDEEMRVSHETIYRSLYAGPRGTASGADEEPAHRPGAASAPPPAPRARRDLRDMVLISDRPPEAADRAVPGHWEGDLILGRGGRSALGRSLSAARV